MRVLPLLLLLALAARADEIRLVVVVSIDQFRADYVDRFADLYEEPGKDGRVGGFKYLRQSGAHHTDAQFDHYPLTTGPGHAVLLTGAPPYKSGVIGNGWYDREWGGDRYCVDMRPPAEIGPETLRVTTIGDELRFARGRAPKLWSLALKDRAAVYLAGHLPDGCIWFDDKHGTWRTSGYYRAGDPPDWITRRTPPLSFEWTLSVPEAALERLWAPGGKHPSDERGLGPSFPHKLEKAAVSAKEYYRAFAATPFANDLILDTALEIVKHEEMGADAVPDLLTINLSANDYVGHEFGPDSAEVLDLSVRTDGALSRFFTALRDTVGLDHILLVVTSDHGVGPNSLAAQEAGLPAGIYPGGERLKRILEEPLAREMRLKATSGRDEVAPVVLAVTGPNVYLADPDLADACAKVLAAQPGIAFAFTRAQILEGRLPDTELGRRIARSFHPKVSGDVVFVPEPFWTPTGAEEGATHGAPHAYDTKVPLLLCGPGIRPGAYHQRVSLFDLAPTLACLLGIAHPSGSEGRILAHLIE